MHSQFLNFRKPVAHFSAAAASSVLHTWTALGRAGKMALHCLLATVASGVLAAETATLSVQFDKPGARINSAMWGVFFEDINFGADGGLYAELVKNRSFEFPDPYMGWRILAPPNTVSIDTSRPASSAQPNFIQVPVGATLLNEGFRGIGVRKGETYVFSVDARARGRRPALRIELINTNGHSLGTARIRGIGRDWKRHTAQLRASATQPHARLAVIVEGSGSVDLDMISLFPRNTWKNRPGGLRADMVQMLADLEPGFLRFPGGCIVEGRYLTNRYQWKNTVGHIAERVPIINRWNDEFARRGRGAADYYQSFGLGFFEYFQLAEDIGAEPMPILNCGMACQFNSSELVPLNELDPYIQDALDLIEFANGPASTRWGALRAKMGHPEPFHMKLLGIGNEQWGPQYIERYGRFAEVLKAKHPEVQLIAAAGPDPAGERFNFLWGKLRELKADIVDEHFYRPPDWFFSNAYRYDDYDRLGPEVFAGEYASHTRERASNLEAALSEAAVMTGFERNADVVRMAAYAPLFAHVDAWQWRPDLIYVDNLNVLATPSYHVQKLFSRNRGDMVLPIKSSTAREERFYASATRDMTTDEVILKVVNATTNAVDAMVEINGADMVATGKLTLLTSSRLTDENTFAHPEKVAPVEDKLDVFSPTFSHSFPPRSVSVLRIPARVTQQ